MSNLHERHPPMGSEKDIECQVTSLTSVNEDMINFSSSSEEDDELALRVKTLLAENEDEQISFEQSKTVEKNSETEDLYSGSNVTIIEDPHLKRVDSSAVSDNSFNQLEISMASTSYYAIADILENQTVGYDFKDRCCGTNTSHMNLGNEPKVLIQSDLSVRPKISLIKPERKNISPKNSKTNETNLKDRESEMSLKRVSFSSSQTYEGNMKILGFMKSSGGATPLKGFEHPSYQPISDLPEECRKHILSAPIYIDSEVLDSNEYSRFTTDNPISSSEVLPHIRWYPYPSYKSSQDFKNASTQTSLKRSKEVGPSSKVLIELNKSFDDSTDATQHLHASETVDLSTVNFCSMLPDWQAGADINLTSSYRSHIDHLNLRHMEAYEDGSSEEVFQSEKLFKLRENVGENSDEAACRTGVGRINLNASQLLLQEVMESSSDDNSRIKQQDDQTKEDNDFHDDQYQIPGRETCDNHKPLTETFSTLTEPATTIKQEFIINLSQEDASTQTSVCNCVNELKSMLKKALDKVISEHVCPCHQVAKKNSEHKKQTEKASSHSEKYDILFLSDDPQTIIIAEDSPLVFKSFLASTVKEESEGTRRLSKGKRRLMDEKKKKDEQKKTLQKLYKKHAQNFARKIKNEALKGSVNYARNECILRQSPIYRH